MNKIKKSIILISVLIIFILIVVLCKPIIEKVKMRKILTAEQEKYVNYLDNPASVVNKILPEKIKIENLYFSVEEIAKQYIDNNKQKNINYLYNVLDKDYIYQHNIQDNDELINKIEIYENEIYETKEIYSLDGSSYTRFYIEMEGKENIYLIINVDFQNETFSVIPSSQREHEYNKSNVLENEQGQEKIIKLNKYNKYNLLYLSEKQIANKYFLNYKNKLLNNVENAYNLVDEDTKKNKVDNINKFKEITQNIQNANLKKYSISLNNGNKEIICITDNDMKITFKISSVMEYKVKL